MFVCRLARELNYLCFCIANCAFDFFEESKQSNVLITLGFCCRDLQTNHFTSNPHPSHCPEQWVGWERHNWFIFLKQAIPFYILEYLKTFSCSIKWLESMAELINLFFFLAPSPPRPPKYLKHMCFHQVWWTHWRLVRKDSHSHECAWPPSTVCRQQEESEIGHAFTHPCSARVKVFRINYLLCVGARERRRPYKYS